MSQGLVRMNHQLVMQVNIALAFLFVIGAFFCFFQGISSGLFLFILAFLLGILIIGMEVFQFIRTSWDATVIQSRKDSTSSSEPLDDLKMRYAKGEITTEQFRQMRKDLGR